MPHSRYLRNAPITEAIIDFRVKARAEFRTEEFASLKTQLSDRFPNVEELRGRQATFEMTHGQEFQPTVQDLGLRGYFF